MIEDLHDFRNQAWAMERLRPQNRNTYRWGGQNVQTIPANTFLPLISGIPTQGFTLITTTGTWTQEPTSFSYQWLSNGSPIGGATSNSYTLQAGDVGNVITVAVTATNQFGNSFPVDAKPTSPIAATLAISGTPVTSATIDQVYTGFTVSATGGWPYYLFNVTNGLLPPGILLNARTGVVSGTPTGLGTYANITITVTDQTGNAISLAPFTLTVSEVPVTISGTPITYTIVNVPYAGFMVTGSGGVPPFTYTVTSGSLPTGITLNSSTGLVSGTPTVIGTSSGIIITATDTVGGNASLPAFSITVAGPAVDALVFTHTYNSQYAGIV